MKELPQDSWSFSLWRIFFGRLANLFRRRARARKEFGNRACQRIRFEPLESRLLLSADIAPVANPDAFSVGEDGTLTISAPGVLGNDTDADNDTLAAVLVSSSTNGALLFNSDGSLTYTPNSNFNGTDSFTYKANDGELDSNMAAVTVSVLAVNDAPVNTVPGPQAVLEDTSLLFSVANGNAIIVSDVDDAGNGVAGDEVVRVTLAAAQGVISLGSLAGLSFTSGDGSSDAGMTFNGTLSSINTALNGLAYAPGLNFNGSGVLTISVDDLGNFGVGTPLSDTDSVVISVLAVNDAPVNTVPGPQAVLEDTSLLFSVANGNAIIVSDVDDAGNGVAGDEVVRVTLAAAQGVISLGSLAGLSFTSGDGSSDAGMTFNGTLSSINTALNGLAYAPGLNFNGSGVLTISVDDLGNFGVGTPLSDTDSVVISVLAVNDAPVNTVPGPQAVLEDTSLLFSVANGNAIIVSDVDDAGNGVAGDEVVRVTLAAAQGVISLGSLAGLSFTSGDGSSDAGMTFNGTLSSINTALNGLAYAPGLNFNGSGVLTISVDDLGNFGVGTPLSDTDSVVISVLAVNDAPVNTVPGPQAVLEDTSLLFSVANGNAIIVSDVDDAGNGVAGDEVVRVTLAAAQGVISLGSLAGLSFTSGDGSSDAGMTFNGTLSSINTALNGLAYAPGMNFNGSGVLTISVDDLGNFGVGTPLSDTDSVVISVLAVNDAPVNTVPGPQAVLEDTSLLFSVANGNAIIVSDVDDAGNGVAGDEVVRVTLAAAQGVISLGSLAGLSFTSGDGSSDAGMTFNGTLSSINTALNGLAYAPGLNFNGSGVLTISVDDLGNFGVGTPLSDTDSVVISVLAVNDAPVNTVPGPQAVLEDTSLLFSVANGNAIIVSDVDDAGNGVAGDEVVRVTLAAAQGVISLGSLAGLSFTSGDGSSDAGMTFNGTLSSINTALNGLAYAPGLNFNGSGVLTISVDDLGNFGVGTPLSDTDSVVISVLAVDDEAPAIVYVDDNFTGSAGTLIVDADPVAGGNQAAVIGVNAFATVQDGVNAVAQDGTVKVNAGTYAESVSITQALTLDGNTISGLAADVVIDPAAGNGITVSGVDADSITIRDLRVTGGVDGINASSVDNLTLTNLQADFNTDDGIEIGSAGTIDFTDVDAANNADAGVAVTGAASFSDSDGIYSNNTNHGIRLIDIAGLVSLTHTTANDNDANNGTIGDGVNMTDGLDAGTEAIGSLLVVGGSFSDTAAPGGQRYGIRVGDGVGVGLVHSVGTTVVLDSVTVTGNQESGVEIEDGGTTASVSGNYSGNLGTGFTIASLSGSFTASDSTFSNNGSHGLSLTSTGDVNLTGVSASGNDPGVFVNGAASFSDTDGVYTGNDNHGIQLIDIAGNVTVIRTVADDNDANDDGVGDGLNATANVNLNAIGGNLLVQGARFRDSGGANDHQERGVFIQSVAGSVTFNNSPGVVQSNLVTGNESRGVVVGDGGTSATFTNGTYSSNADNGIDVASLSGEMTLGGVIASGNANAGVAVTGAASFSDSGGIYSNNTNHGIRLIDIAGLVSLTHTTANDNDANNGTIGDGVNMTDGALDADTNAIGSLLVVGGSFSDTATPGGQRFGIRVGNGVGPVVHGVGTTVVLDGVTVIGNQESGVEIEDGGTTASVSGNYSGNLGTGFTIASLSGSFTASDSTFSNNGSHGLSLTSTGDVNLTGVSASGNDPGVFVNGAASFSDTDGVYTGNDNHGIQLIDIAGNVTVIRTVADDNDANNDGVGDGVNMTDGAGDADTNAVGSLSVTGGSFSDTAAAGGERVGIRVGDGIGIGAVHSVATTVAFQSDTAVGPLQNVSVTGNQENGVEIEDGGTTASFSGNGNYSLNLNAGIAIASLSDGFTAADSTFNLNTNHGIRLIDIGGVVSLTRVTANDNDANNGTIGDGVNMTDGADAGTDAIGSLLVVGGSFSDTATPGGQRFGIRVGNGVGPVVHSVAGTVDFQSGTVAGALQHVSITGNQESGVEIEDGGTTATFTNGTYSNNGGDGINLASLATTLTVSGVTASNNAGDGLDISGGGTIAFLSGVFSNNASGRGVNLASDTIFVNGSLSSGTGAIVLTAPSGVFFTADAVLHVDLGGTAAGQFTKVTISNAVTLDGALDAALVNGFVPANGDRFQFMTFTSRLGFFDATTLPAQLYVDQSDPADLELVFDSTPPTVTIDQAATQTDPTATSPVLFAVHFSEVITGFTGSDISFAGSTVGGTLTAVVTGSGQDYTVSVTGMSGDGQVVASLPAGAAVDVAGNLSLASTSTDNMVFFGHAPDLIGTVQWVPDAVIVPGQQEHVTVSVINVGDRPAHDPAVVKLYASVNAVLDASDILLDQGTVSGVINPGASKKDQLNFEFPGTVPPGTYFLLAVVDATSNVLESNEANNVAVGPVFNVGGISSLGLEAPASQGEAGGFAGNSTFGTGTPHTGVVVDWQAGSQGGWGAGLNPFSPNKPGQGISPNFADFLINLGSADRGAQGGYDSLGSELLGNGRGKPGR